MDLSEREQPLVARGLARGSESGPVGDVAVSKPTAGAAKSLDEQPHLARAQEYLRSHIYDEISVDDVASAIGCTARNVQLIFRRHLGVTPMRYLKKLRMEDARRRLLSGAHETAGRIATSLGFTNLGRFSRDYRAMFGELPSSARKAHERARRQK
ncbi:MAG: AraC family transcriptional regulator [Beijerinckiaceae bacterium]